MIRNPTVQEEFAEHVYKYVLRYKGQFKSADAYIRSKNCKQEIS